MGALTRAHGDARPECSSQAVRLPVVLNLKWQSSCRLYFLLLQALSGIFKNSNVIVWWVLNFFLLFPVGHFRQWYAVRSGVKLRPILFTNLSLYRSVVRS